MRQEKEQKLVAEILFWGNQLGKFAADVFPSMFTGVDNKTMDEFGTSLASKVLTELNSRGAVLLAQSVDSMAEKVGELELDEAGESVWTIVRLSWSIERDIAADLLGRRHLMHSAKTSHANSQIVRTSAVKNVGSGVHLQTAGRSQPSLSSLKQSRAPTIIVTSEQNITRAKSPTLFELFDWLPK